MAVILPAKAPSLRGTAVKPQASDARIEAGDVLVLLGTEQDCAAAEIKLMQG